MLVTGEFGHRKTSLRLYGLIAFLTVATIGLSNTAVGYLNYPTQVWGYHSNNSLNMAA